MSGAQQFGPRRKRIKRGEGNRNRIPPGARALFFLPSILIGGMGREGGIRGGGWGAVLPLGFGGTLFYLRLGLAFLALGSL